jgi:hypothetical protein
MSTEAPPPPARNYSSFAGYDLFGNDLAIMQDTTQAVCQLQCEATEACKAFLFGSTSGGDCNNCCWLKHATGLLTTYPGLTAYLPAGVAPQFPGIICLLGLLLRKCSEQFLRSGFKAALYHGDASCLECKVMQSNRCCLVSANYAAKENIALLWLLPAFICLQEYCLVISCIY